MNIPNRLTILRTILRTTAVTVPVTRAEMRVIARRLRQVSERHTGLLSA